MSRIKVSEVLYLGEQSMWSERKAGNSRWYGGRWCWMVTLGLIIQLREIGFTDKYFQACHSAGHSEVLTGYKLGGYLRKLEQRNTG